MPSELSYLAVVPVDETIFRYATAPDAEEAIRRAAYLAVLEHGRSHQLAGEMVSAEVYVLDGIPAKAIVVDETGAVHHGDGGPRLDAAFSRRITYPLGPLLYEMIASEAFVEWYTRRFVPAAKGTGDVSHARLAVDLERLIKGLPIRYPSALDADGGAE